jgi:Zn finger protein HypA/HybF involved in hydrogenase expression
VVKIVRNVINKAMQTQAAKVSVRVGIVSTVSHSGLESVVIRKHTQALANMQRSSVHHHRKIRCKGERERLGEEVKMGGEG